MSRALPLPDVCDTRDEQDAYWRAVEAWQSDREQDRVEAMEG